MLKNKKKVIGTICALAAVILLASCTGKGGKSTGSKETTTKADAGAKGSDEPILIYDFESANVDGKTVKDVGTGDDKADNATLNGNAAIDGGKLVLDGTNGTYLEFPKGFFDGRKAMTISMDVKSDLSSGNFFTFAYGQNDQKYSFLRVRGTDIYSAITKGSFGAENSVSTNDGAAAGEWQNIMIVINGKKQSLYVNGALKGSSDAQTSPSELGSNLLGYLGKSFYGGDGYFKGAFDNVKVYNKALGREEIDIMFNLKSGAIYDITSDKQQFAWDLNEGEKKITLYFFKNGQFNKDLTKVALNFKLNSKATIKSQPETFDFTGGGENKVSIEFDGNTTEYTLTGDYGVNPVIEGQFADPDIDYFNGKYYIYPTTDGFPGWGGYQFSCFSSEDLVNWKNEGKILDVKNEGKTGADNTNEIPGVPWAVGNAWAPTIEAKNGKYYFYFCAKRSDGVSCIGVAVADSPAGPYVAEDQPLLTPEICASEGKINGGQTIDPSIFTDDDGKSYMLFGNGYGAIVQLGDDMKSIVPGTMHKYSGTTDLRESIIVIKRNGIYHFTWSCDDTGSENYHVNYGTSDSLYGAIQYKGTILSKDTEKGILGTGHHSILYVKDKNEYYIAYHRFLTPIGRFKSDFGIHREVCVDRLTFDETTGLMNKVTPTHTGPVK